jgi:hypothetical protein
MGASLYRLFAFIGLVLLILLGWGTACGFWWGAHAQVPSDMTNPEQIKQFTQATTQQFSIASFPFAFPGALFIAAFIAFGRRPQTLVPAAALSLFMYFCITDPEWPAQLARGSLMASVIQTTTQTASPSAGPELPAPSNGEVQTYTAGTPLADFTIRSAPGTNYLVKLADPGNGNVAMTVFVIGGNTVNVKVPLGTYLVKYASGTKWYGYRDLFGPTTSYSKADAPLSFSQNGSEISGYTITLYKVENGNLQTKAITPSEF